MEWSVDEEKERARVYAVDGEEEKERARVGLSHT